MRVCILISVGLVAAGLVAAGLVAAGSRFVVVETSTAPHAAHAERTPPPATRPARGTQARACPHAQPCPCADRGATTMATMHSYRWLQVGYM